MPGSRAGGPGRLRRSWIGGDEHQQVHDQVDLRGDHREDPVGAGHVRDQRVAEGDHRGDAGPGRPGCSAARRSCSASAGTAAGSPPAREISSRPLDGPASQVSMPPSEAVTSMIPTIGVSHWVPKLANTASNACITPAVSESSSAGTIQLIASAGRMKISQHQAHRQEHRLRELLAGVLQRRHVDGVHLHAGVGQEVVDDQHEAGQPGPGRAAGGRRSIGAADGVALAEEDDAEDDQDDAGDQGADDQAAAGQAGDALGAAGGDPDAGPVDDDDDAARSTRRWWRARG